MHRHTISPEYLRAYVAPQYAPQCSERRTTQLLRCSMDVVEDHELGLGPVQNLLRSTLI